MENIHVKGNTYVLDLDILMIPYYKLNENQIVLLDSGLKDRHQEKLKEFLIQQNYKVKGILCTHNHVDHIGNVNFLKERDNCIVALPEEEALGIGSMEQLELFFSPIPRDQIFSKYGHMIFIPDVMIRKEDKELEFCGAVFKVIHTPGHSVDHVGFITPDGVSYLGDALLSHDVMNISKLPYTQNLLKDLISKMGLYHIEASYHVLAHKGVYADIKDLITDNIYYYKSHTDMILNHMKESLSFDELFIWVMDDLSIYINSSNKQQVMERILKGYVNYLEETNKIQRLMTGNVLKYRVIR